MIAKKIYRLGTRRSQLAQTQSETVRQFLMGKGLIVEMVLIESEGDQNRTEPLYAIPGASPGLFTKQLENALLAGEIDLAVHSLKDLPTLQPAGLKVGAITVREDSSDVMLVHPDHFSPASPLGLKTHAVVGTSSLRREALLLSMRKDLKVVPLRGNVPTRVEKVRSGALAGAVLAQAGLNRLKLDLSGLHAVILPQSNFIPAPGQGALAIELRTDASSELLQAVAALNSAESELETRVERRILRELEGGCTLPLGVRCVVEKPTNLLKVKAFLGVRKTLPEPPSWLGFHHFDFSHIDEESLIASVVEHFKGILHAN